MDDTTKMTAVADTAILVAAIRAGESTRDDRLFTDPFAARLAGDEGTGMLQRMVAEAGGQSTVQIVVRTRFWDEALLSAAQTCDRSSPRGRTGRPGVSAGVAAGHHALRGGPAGRRRSQGRR